MRERWTGWEWKYADRTSKFLDGASLVAQMVESACSAGDQGLIPELGMFPREGNGNPLQCSCLENPMDRGAWWTTVHGDCKESDTTEWLSHTHTQIPRWPTILRGNVCFHQKSGAELVQG